MGVNRTHTGISGCFSSKNGHDSQQTSRAPPELRGMHSYRQPISAISKNLSLEYI